MTFKQHVKLLTQAISQWNEDQAMTQSAALSYYTVFSIAPLLLITLSITGLIFGEDASRGEIFNSIAGLIGAESAHFIEAVVQASSKKTSGMIATAIALFTLLLGASSVFGQLQESLNFLWKVKPKPHSGLGAFLRHRFLSFSMTLVIAFLLLVSLLASAALSAWGAFASKALPGGEVIWQFLNLVIPFTLITALFAAIFKILPDVKLAWQDVWRGGAITAMLFSLGRFLIGYYLGHGAVTSTYQVAGSMVIILIWAYYSSALLFLGAEYTKAYSEWRTGKKAPPKEYARSFEGGADRIHPSKRPLVKP